MVSTGAAILASGVLSSAGQYLANKQNVALQNKWNSEQINLANTAHQREVADLELAGLNPILSAQGSGASVPQLTAANVGNVGEGVAGAMSSAAKVEALERPKVASQVAVNSATANNLLKQNELISAQIRNTDANTLRTLEDADHPGAWGSAMQSLQSMMKGSEASTMYEKMFKADHPSSARTIHELPTVEVEAPRHRWWHHFSPWHD